MTNRPRYMVVVPPDFRRTPALFRAMALAKRSEAELLLAVFEFDRGLDKARAHGFDLDAYLKGRGRELEEFAAHLRREGFAVKTRVRWGHPVTSSMLEEILSVRPDLVLKDVHAESAVKRLLFTAQDLELLRLCPVPLMLVKPGSGALPKHVVAAVDPLDEYGRSNQLNEDILKAAEKYGMQTDASVEVVHAFQFIPLTVDPGFMSGWVPDLTLQQELRDLHAKSLRDLGTRFGVEERHLHMLDGDPARLIADFVATYHTGLVIMGTVNRNDMERLFMGSVAEELLDRLHCDVLALKPAGFAAELAERLDSHSSKAA